MCHYYFPGLILNLVVANFAGGVHSDLGDPLRLPVPQVVRRHRQIRQGVRPRRLGARQPGQPAQSSPACLSVCPSTAIIITVECEFDSTFLRSLRGGLLVGYY